MGVAVAMGRMAQNPPADSSGTAQVNESDNKTYRVW
jgi:hypothetical protein